MIQTLSVLACETHIVFSTPTKFGAKNYTQQTERLQSSGPFNQKNTQCEATKTFFEKIPQKHHQDELSSIPIRIRKAKKKGNLFFKARLFPITLERCPWRIGCKAAGIELPGGP